MQPSAEIRWFQTGPIPTKLSKWFALQPLVEKEDARTDTYLVLLGSKAVGLKLREGRFEIKAEREPPREVTFTKDVTGYADAWTKFSLESPVVAELECAIIASGEPLISIDKVRYLQRYSLDSGTPEPVSGKKPLPKEGCLFELTDLIVGKQKYWTLGFEAFGVVDRLSAYVVETAQRVFAVEDCPQPLRLGASLSYPAWIMSLPPARKIRIIQD